MTDLNELYSPSRWSKRLSADVIVDVHGKFMQEKSDVARATVPYETIKFSDGTETYFEVFSRNIKFTKKNRNCLDDIDFNGSPIFVYLHGGYWQWGSVFSSSYMADNFTNNGITVVALGYDIAPAANLNQIVEQVELGISKVLKCAQLSNSKVFICGHSAGAQLAAMMLCVNFMNKYNVSDDALAGLILVSGVFDLTPLVQTDINENLKMDLDVASKNSPLLLDNIIFKKPLSIIIAYGEFDTPAFKTQSDLYFKELENKFDVKLYSIPDVDHFNVVENLSTDNYLLTQEIYKIINAIEA